MADTSPGKVQVLRAMFAQKNEPVMGCMKPGTKMNRPFNRSMTSLTDDTLEEKHAISPVSVTATQAILRAIQTTDLHKQHGGNNNALCNNASKVLLKPSLGPKPTFSRTQTTTLSSPRFNHRTSGSALSSMQSNNVVPPRTCHSESNGYGLSRSEIAETVASFMFGDTSNAHSSKARYGATPEGSRSQVDSCYKTLVTPSRMVNGTNTPFNAEPSRTGENMKPKSSSNMCVVNSLISSDNYICKSGSNFRRKELPPKERLGPPPLKPIKPPHMKLPERFLRTNMILNSHRTDYQEQKPTLPPKRGDSSSPALHKPAYPCPPRPPISPPVPPSNTSFKSVTNGFPSNNTAQLSKPKSLFEEIEQLYEDTLSEGSSSVIPEYTEEEEEAELEDLYDDAVGDNYNATNSNHIPQPPKPKYPSSAYHPSIYLEPNGIPEEIYHDTDEPIDDELYEIMPVDELEEGHYSNNMKEVEKLKREEEKKLRRESKEKQKKEKEIEKVKKKFGLNGDELAIDAGFVKADSRGGRSDLPVKKGETVYILRMEGNPAGKWLVKNKKGKCGYVELTNIEVDPDSVKSVMTVKRSSVISTSEELYSEAYSEQEGIYEMTY